MSFTYRRGAKGIIYWKSDQGQRLSTGTSSEAEAQPLIKRWEEKAFRSAHGIIDNDMSWFEYREEYSRGYRANSENSIVKLGYVLNSFERILKLNENGHSKTLLSITTPHCENWRAVRLGEVAPITVDAEEKYIRPLFAKARDLGYLDRNPWAPIRRLKFAKREAKRGTFGEGVRFLECIEPQYHLLGILLSDTGMRREEIAAQRMEDIDLVRALLYIRNHEDACKCELCEKKRKADRKSLRPGLFNTKNLSERVIPLSPRLHNALILLSQTQKTGCLWKYHELTITEVCKRAWTKAQVEGKLGAHTFRHMFADDMRRAGVDESVRKAILGHGKQDVHDTYMHVDLAEIIAGANKLWEWRGSQTVNVEKQVVNGLTIFKPQMGGVY